MEKLMIPVYILIIIIKKIFSNRLLLAVVVIGAIGLFVVGSLSSSKPQGEKKVSIPAYQTIAPSKAIAPQVAVTPSRVYYVVASHEEGKYRILTDYYDYNQKSWEHKIIPLPLLKTNVQMVGR